MNVNTLVVVNVIVGVFNIIDGFYHDNLMSFMNMGTGISLIVLAGMLVKNSKLK